MDYGTRSEYLSRMNSDICKNVMAMDQTSCTKSSETEKITAELSLQKQLPFCQQISRHLLKHNSAMPRTDFFIQEDMTNKTDLSGFAFAKNDMKYVDNLGIKPEDKSTSMTPTQESRTAQQNLNYWSKYKENPYLRPVSASEAAESFQYSKMKHNVTASQGVLNLSEKSAVLSQSQMLQRNSFLRPLSKMSLNKIKQVTSDLRNSASSIKQDSHDSILLQRQHSFGPESCVNSCLYKISSEQRNNKFESLASYVTDNPQIVIDAISCKSPFASNSSSKMCEPDLQRSATPDINSFYSSTKSHVKHKSSVIRQTDSLYQSISPYNYGTFPPILSDLSTFSSPSTLKSTDEGQSQILSTGNVIFKKMPVTNTLTGIVYSGCKTEAKTKTNFKVTSRNTNSSNLAWENLHEEAHKDIVLDKQTSKPPSYFLTLEKFKAKVQSVYKPSTQETKIDTITQTCRNKGLVIERNVQNGKPPKPPMNLNTPANAVQMLTRTHNRGQKMEQLSLSKSSLEKVSDCLSEKEVPRRTIGLNLYGVQRSIGDGAPLDAKKLTETSQNKSPKLATSSDGECDEEMDDDCNKEENYVDFNGCLDDYEGKDVDRSSLSSMRERLPGDGEASIDDTDEDELESLDVNSSDDGVDRYSIEENISGNSRPPKSAISSQIHACENALLDLNLNPDFRAATNCGAPVTRPALRYSLFQGIPPTINFVAEGEKTEQLPLELCKMMKWKMSPITPMIVKSALARVGFKITRKHHDWLGCFGKHMKSECFKSLREYQKLNHFPGSFQIGRKDKLWRSLSKMQMHFGKREFNFFPQTFVLPGDMKLLKQAWEESNSKQKWIVKPPASARGIGIRVISKWIQIPKRRPVIVQKYIHRPFLINASKFDMRVYVYVTCYDPLRLYVYDDGLARFASCKYSTSAKTLNNRYMHLTNYSVNKKNTEYLSNTDNAVCQGHKWSLKALWNYMKRQGINTTLIWETIRDLIIKTIISRYCCHELFGFDILLDEKFKPWILEVNISPSLHSNSQLDINIKGAMIKDMLNIAGYRLPDEHDISSSYTTGASTPSGTLCMDKRLFTNQLSPDERAKHAFYCQRYQEEQVLSSVLDILTPDDVRLLCESIDEDSRKGNFQRLFPTPNTHCYLRYFEQPRYYNLLLDQWVLRYNHMEQKGIMLLQSLCEKGLHLQNPTTNPQHQWSAPKPSFVRNRSADARVFGLHNSPRERGHILCPSRREIKKFPPRSGPVLDSSRYTSLSFPSPPQHSTVTFHPVASSGSALSIPILLLWKQNNKPLMELFSETNDSTPLDQEFRHYFMQSGFQNINIYEDVYFTSYSRSI